MELRKTTENHGNAEWADMVIYMAARRVARGQVLMIGLKGAIPLGDLLDLKSGEAICSHDRPLMARVQNGM